MSTSRQRQTPINYMGSDSNVLWELEPGKQSDVAFHRGADISMLSQYAGEQEVLFPPGTMLVVKLSCESVDKSSSEYVDAQNPPGGHRRGSKESVLKLAAGLQVQEESAQNGKKWLSVRVRPYFI
eukprot:gnl/TRDRNA2_/TRDRNA2_177828_c0_seq5.p1 gnl/TRDRNA2_/TRDRNA2_177828_c0~~gnl/TRDRNA2_/TRDRNA2_177828_c0_seq5.p1  ORF type:complete len:125 (-),score=11.00 gnl/TRDRNA2_/TRDRNA2_177828_c0_seq5:103-477(-)